MNKDNIINDIINLPEIFYKRKNESIYSLLKESGYFESYNQISEANIFEELVKNPECIQQWLIWSADKRSKSGWYFKASTNLTYIVGFFPPNEELRTSEYNNIAQACAVFIKRELENIRTS